MTKRVLVAIDVDEDLATEDVAFGLEWEGFSNATVWTPEDFGTTLVDRFVADEADGALVDAVNDARDVAAGDLLLGPCEWCEGQPVPGVVVPPLPKDDGTYAVERCDGCRRYPDDEAAARAVATN